MQTETVDIAQLKETARQQLLLLVQRLRDELRSYEAALALLEPANGGSGHPGQLSISLDESSSPAPKPLTSPTASVEPVADQTSTDSTPASTPASTNGSKSPKGSTSDRSQQSKAAASAKAKKAPARARRTTAKTVKTEAKRLNIQVKNAYQTEGLSVEDALKQALEAGPLPLPALTTKIFTVRAKSAVPKAQEAISKVLQTAVEKGIITASGTGDNTSYQLKSGED